MDIVNIDSVLADFPQNRTSERVAGIDGYDVRLVKTEGDVPWHQHDAQEMHLVLDGALTLVFRDGNEITLRKGDINVIPAGIEHCAHATPGTNVIVFEPSQQ
ncbi:cupin domain-containing protein [Streptomyces sp. NPDC046727]|uniref:cupin domain-containing protein n=1 Tax=Streptomyces sp. NPDC046727 TaxID=3155373 RepID=UPI0033C403B9